MSKQNRNSDRKPIAQSTLEELRQMCIKKNGQCHSCPFTFCIEDDLKALMKARYRTSSDPHHGRIGLTWKVNGKEPKGRAFVYYDPTVNKYVSLNNRLESDVHKAITRSSYYGALEDFYRLEQFPNIVIKEVML
jgi:5-methylcytosine-specific restriction endonuclease McrA